MMGLLTMDNDNDNDNAVVVALDILRRRLLCTTLITKLCLTVVHAGIKTLLPEVK